MTQCEVYCVSLQRLLEHEVTPATAYSTREHSPHAPHQEPVTALTVLLYVINSTEKLSNAPADLRMLQVARGMEVLLLGMETVP